MQLSRVSHRAARSCAWLAPRARHRGKLYSRSSSLIQPGFLSNRTGPDLVSTPCYTMDSKASAHFRQPAPLPIIELHKLDFRVSYRNCLTKNAFDELPGSIIERLDIRRDQAGLGIVVLHRCHVIPGT